MLHTEQTPLITRISSPSLPSDIMGEIAKHVSYTKGLSVLRQTSKDNDLAVEETDAGKSARKASDLEPGAIATYLADESSNDCLLLCVNMGVIGGISTGMGVGVGVWGGTTSCLIGGMAGICGGIVLGGCGGLISNLGLFANNRHVEEARQERDTIRGQLNYSTKTANPVG